MLMVLPVAAVFAQKSGGTYDWGVGFKYQPTAISIKHYAKQGDAIELLLTNHKEGYRATMLLELAPSLNPGGSKSLRFVLGPGIHAGYQKDKYKVRHESNVVFGFDGIIGLEWKLPKIPFSIQADYQPSVDVAGNDDMYTNWGGATIRYTF